MWTELPIERFLHRFLAAKLSPEMAKRLSARYQTAADTLATNILPWIAGQEPNLTDHGIDHVANVLNNAQLLLGLPEEYAEDYNSPLNPVELYLLCMTVLFHDVGNLFGRNRHNHKVANVYGEVFKGLLDEKDEKLHVIRAARAHCGTSSAGGSRDTLKELGETPTYAYSQVVRLQMIGAVVRLADELAEGPQRTSSFLVAKGLFDPDSMHYHEYAQITRVNIDRGGERIALTYHICLDSYRNEEALSRGLDRLQRLLEMAYSRILKLDQERRYARHYCNILAPFKATSVKIDLWVDDWVLEPSLPPLTLNDLVIPGEDARSVSECSSDYKIDAVLQRVRAHVASGW